MFFSAQAYVWKEDNCLLICGMSYKVQLSNYGNNKPISPSQYYGDGDVLGCGIMLGVANKMTIFFTFNGVLAGEFIGINRNGLYKFNIYRKEGYKQTFG
jgi:hypothetical protein